MPTNLEIMDEIRQADKLANIIWLPNTVALLRAAREERDMWQIKAEAAEQRAQMAEAQLARQLAATGSQELFAPNLLR